MKRVVLAMLLLPLAIGLMAAGHETKAKKPTPDEAIEMLKAGNERFASGKSEHPRADAERLKLAGSSDQGDYAYATVIACSDSRVPVELIFDAGVMDLFVIRVAGNVCDTDEVGSIEYGLAHVNTPVLVVLGHTSCGAVTAVTAAAEGHGHELERNIPPLVDNIQPAVEKAKADHPDKHGKDLVPHAVEENVWVSVRDLFMASPATRELVKSGKAKVVGAIYDLSTGKVEWLPEEKVASILKEVEADPKRAMNKMAGQAEEPGCPGKDCNCKDCPHKDKDCPHKDKDCPHMKKDRDMKGSNSKGSGMKGSGTKGSDTKTEDGE